MCSWASAPPPEPEEVAEWLIATAEDPLTRHEAMGELRRADESAAALGDVDLFELVRPWAGEPALRWLIQRFQGGEPASDWLASRVMALLAAELDDPVLRRLVREAEEEAKGLQRPVVVGSPEQAEMDEQLAAVEKKLREQFLRALAQRR